MQEENNKSCEEHLLIVYNYTLCCQLASGTTLTVQRCSKCVRIFSSSLDLKQSVPQTKDCTSIVSIDVHELIFGTSSHLLQCLIIP